MGKCSQATGGGFRARPEEEVRYSVRVAAAYSWRLIVVGVAVYLVFAVLGRLTLVAVALFFGLLIAALLRPLVDLLARALPRGLSVGLALLLTVFAFGGVFTRLPALHGRLMRTVTRLALSRA